MRRVPEQTTFEEAGRLRVCASAFIKEIIMRAAKLLDDDTETARAGIKYYRHGSNRSYSVFKTDFPIFAQYLTFVLQDRSLREACGMTCVRFYTDLHGLRLDKESAHSTLNSIVEINHSHIDVLQIHRADVLQCDEYSAIVIKMTGRQDPRSLAALYRDAVNLSGKIDRYKTGFLADFDYFRRHASPPMENHIVTYAQAYSSAAKMARPTDCGFVPTYVISRGYAIGSRTMNNLAESTRQYILDLKSYCKKYVRSGQCLRIEEVLTFDATRVQNIADAIRRLGVFDDETRTLTTRALLERRLVYRLSYWSNHFDDSVGADLRFLKRIIHCDQRYRSKLWIPYRVVARTTRAEFCVMYFIHRRNISYNYMVMRMMFINGNEAASTFDGLVHLRALNDDTYDYEKIPLYASNIPIAIAKVIRHLRLVHRHMPSEFNSPSHAVRYIVTCCAAWAYTRCILTGSALDNVDMAEIIASFANDYQSAFTLDRFLGLFASYKPTNCRVRIASHAV